MESRVLLSGYSLNTLTYFGANATGANPQSTLVSDGHGNLYGTAAVGGTYNLGTVFEIANGSTAITTLASFNPNIGRWGLPSGLTLDASGNLLGTTAEGGADGDGSVFEFAKGSNVITTVASFTGTNGEYPPAGVILDSAGDMYGTTQRGGANSYGTVFEIASGSNTITTLASFGGNAIFPYAGVTLDGSGNLYGTTSEGGASNYGTVFEITKGSKAITTIASFTNSTGGDPYAGVTVDPSGNLYGTTSEGPNLTYSGVVFEIASGSNTITILGGFTGTNGDRPTAGVTLDGSGNLYGLTRYGGSDDFGAVYEIAKGSAGISAIASFSNYNGAYPLAALTMDVSGNLYGTTDAGGANGAGTVFKIAAGTNTITAVASFDPLGATSSGGDLTLDASGNIYGTTRDGGPSNLGTVFEIAKTSGAITTLASFNSATGYNLQSGVTFDASGNLYGTTSEGGPNNYGTVFELASGSNAITTLASFNYSMGEYPDSQVMLDAAGNIYGTAEYGGANGDGTVFEVVKGSNAITALASFNGGDGAYPRAGLAPDAAGNLYGTTDGGGVNGDGTVFEIASHTTTITTLATFDGTNGIGTLGGITLDTAGNLYGTTYTGGKNNDGTVFEIGKGSTTLTTLADLDGADGETPYAGLAVDAAGNLYGTCYGGGDFGAGTVFELASGSNAITTLTSFDNASGSGPQCAVSLNVSGDLFGTTGGGGIVFELLPIPTVTLALTAGTNPCDLSQTLTFTATASDGVSDGQTLTLEDASNSNRVIAKGTLSGGSATFTVPSGALPAGTHNLIAVYGGDATFAAGQSAGYLQTVNPDPLPSYIATSAGAAYNYNATTGALNLTSGTLTFTADNTLAPLINLTASGPASGVFFDISEHLAGLTLSGGAQATMLSLGSARTHSDHDVLVIGTAGSISDPTFSIDPSSKLDLTDNDLIVHTGSSDNGNGVSDPLGVPSTNQLAAVRAMALVGRHVAAGSVLDGTWTGNGLTSSSAASVDAAAGYEQNVLAVVQNSDQMLGKLSAWTVGSISEPLGSNDIIVKYTYNGDAALEGFVGDDSVTMVNGFYDGGKSVQNDWAFGDFTGNGKVDDNDVTILNGLYGNGTPGSGLPQL